MLKSDVTAVAKADNVGGDLNSWNLHRAFVRFFDRATTFLSSATVDYWPGDRFSE